GNTQILFDPGPDCLVHAIKRKLNPAKLEAIILSHKHLDHSGDINVMIEAMTNGGRGKRGRVFAPADALGQDYVILPYLRSYPESIEVLTEGGSYRVNDISFETPIRHIHAVETYGFTFQTPRHSFSWITDTRYFDNLPGYYTGELLIINVVLLSPRAPVDHLSLPEAREIIKEIRPRKVIITHFGMTLWQSKPWKLAQELSQETGISVTAAYDGMKFDLVKLEK
ncbi:MAG: MBL fold metallo-hydrolase, partial [Chloroflexota bacterium]|nr:MBL fold metallo-hydrolase [Chloroflexota bacterium]